MTFSKRSYITLLLIIVAFIALLFFVIHNTSSPKPNASLNGKYRLVFDDEFNAASLDKTKWNTCYDWYSITYRGCTNSGNNEQEWYTSQSVSLKGGSLFLTAKRIPTIGEGSYDPKPGDPTHSFPYQSGMISTGKILRTGKPKWTGGYGYYEIRAKLPTGKGMWPAFWLLPADDKWPPEIDAMELLGDKPNNILMTYFWSNGHYPPPKDTATFTGTNFTQGWHTFAIDWQPGTITWYLDGINRKSVHSNHVPNAQMQIIATLAVGGTLPGNPTSDTSFPQSMQIDYIRAYQQLK